MTTGSRSSGASTAHFEVTLLDLRERILPELDDEFAKIGRRGADRGRAAHRDPRCARHARAEAEARHAFADRIIDFASSNATVELPEVMIANEIEIMRDELRTGWPPQRIGMEQYLALAKQSPEELAAPSCASPLSAASRSLLVLSAIAEKEGIDASAERDRRRDRRSARRDTGSQARRIPGPRAAVVRTCA